MCIQILETVSDRKQQTKSIPHPSYKYMYIYYITYIPCILYVLHSNKSPCPFPKKVTTFYAYCTTLSDIVLPSRNPLYIVIIIFCVRNPIYIVILIFCIRNPLLCCHFCIRNPFFQNLYLYLKTLYLNLFYTISVDLCY